MLFTVATTPNLLQFGGRRTQKDAVAMHSGSFDQYFQGDPVFKRMFYDGSILIFEDKPWADAYVNQVYGSNDSERSVEGLKNSVVNAVISRYGQKAADAVVKEYSNIKGRVEIRVLFLKTILAYLYRSVNYLHMNPKPVSAEAIVHRDALGIAVKLSNNSYSAPESVKEQAPAAPQAPAGQVETPAAPAAPVNAPVAEETAPVKEEAPAAETPAEAPVVKEEAPAAQVNTPVAEETAPVKEEAPAAQVNTPVAEETAPVKEEAPAAPVEAPAAEIPVEAPVEAPVVKEEAPAADTPAPAVNLPTMDMSVTKIKEWCAEYLPKGYTVNFKNSKEVIISKITAIMATVNK